MWRELETGNLDRQTRLTIVMTICLLSASVVGIARADNGATAATPPPSRVATHPKESPLESRVQMLAKGLDLDLAQQAKLRMVLENQREELLQVWREAAVPASARVGATRAINSQTADRIRALLTEEQRKKYKPPEQFHEGSAATGTRTIEDWMKMANPPPRPATAQ